jgi:ribosomal protein L7/L12
VDVALVVCGGLLVILAVAQAAVWVHERRHPRPPLVSAEDARCEVLAVAAGGRQRDEIRAVRVLRERTGLGLLEAKQTVDRWLSESRAA